MGRVVVDISMSVDGLVAGRTPTSSLVWASVAGVLLQPIGVDSATVRTCIPASSVR